MICPKCHTVNDDEEKYCKNCGFQLNSARICPECGKTNDPNSKYCKECGTVLTPVNTFRKQIIEENTKKSFFSMYKVPIICALVILLAVGAVTGMAYYNGNSGGDDDFSIIPLDNNYTGFFDDTDDSTEAQMQENDTNETNETLNETNVTNASKTLTEKVNKTNKTNQTVKVNKTNQTKTIKETVNKTKPSNNSSKINSSSSKDNSSKTITEKVNKTEKSDKSDKNKKDNKNKIGSPDENDSGAPVVIPEISDNDTDDNNSESIIDEIINDSDNGSETYSENVSDTENDTLEEDILNSSEPTEIEMEDVPNLAQKVSQRNYAFSTIDYNDQEFSEAQCIDIFSQYLLNIDKGSSSPIEIKDVKDAPNSSGEDLSQSIEKSDYLSIANRVHSWINTKDTVPNYVGISTVGADDLSDEKMLKLFTLTILEYSITGELPESVEI